MPSKPFRPGYEVVAAQPFTFAGVKYAVGERFPYRDLGVIDFDLGGLWRADLVEFRDEPYRARAAAPAPAPAVTKPQQQNQAPQRR